jgi:hypothetical protein
MRSRHIALAVLVASAFGWGAICLFNRQFASGEVYPDFSSLRTDRMGTKLLYDSLRSLPGVAAERNFLPLDFLPQDGAAVLLLGMNPLKVNWNDGLVLRSAEATAGRGNRVVIAMYINPNGEHPSQKDFEHRDDPKKQPPELRTRWGVTLQLDPEPGALHPLSFREAVGWKVLESGDAGALTIERAFGKGTVVLMAESAEFTNAAAVSLDGVDDVAEALGPYRRIIFDEQHLGIAESGSIVGMARQFRLMGLALGLALCAALFIWRNASSFPPPAVRAAADRFSGRTSHAGLLTLLKRHIPPAELAAVCWREWLATNRNQAKPEIREQAETIVAGAAARPVEATREIQALLHAKGRL